MDYPFYHQAAPNSCAVEATRMIGESLKGEKLDRSKVRGCMVNKGVYFQVHGNWGTTFDVLNRVFVVFNLGAKLFTSNQPGDIAARLWGNSLCLIEVGAHCVIADSATNNNNGTYSFQLRDPAQYDVETNVPDTDPRVAGQHRVWQVSS